LATDWVREILSQAAICDVWPAKDYQILTLGPSFDLGLSIFFDYSPKKTFCLLDVNKY
jgi:hypothetical protein